MTTEGDIIYGDTGGTPARLAAGTSGYVLETQGRDPRHSGRRVVERP